MISGNIKLWSIILPAAILISFGQNPYTIGNEFPATKNTIDIQQNKGEVKIEKVFLDQDSSKNCYTILYPPTSDVKGYLFLLPGYGETAERVLVQSSLPLHMAQNGILTIIPTLQDGVLSFGIDEPSQHSFEKIIADVRKKNKLSNLPFYTGGYSIGGSCVLKYAEEADKKPDAVFAIDPPVDFEQLYLTSKRNIRLSAGAPPRQESIFLVQKIEEIMNGTPELVRSNYHKISPYSFSDTSQTAIKKLIKTPVRIYTEPDIHWWMKERGADFTGMNSTYHSAMINELNRLGNQEAVLITTTNKGYRVPNNERHPHSWSIADPADLLPWLLSHP